MTNKKIAVFINGPINSGKTTIAKIVSDKIANGVFIDGDNLVSENGEPLDVWIKKSIEEAILKARLFVSENKIPIISFPLRDEDWEAISILKNEDITPICITLSPKLETVLYSRKNRKLEKWEIERTKQMYAEGYNSRKFSSLIIENDEIEAEETAKIALEFLKC